MRLLYYKKCGSLVLSVVLISSKATISLDYEKCGSLVLERPIKQLFLSPP